METLKFIKKTRNTFVSASALSLLLFANINANAQCIDSAQIDPTLTCITSYDPVCGCDGTTYSNSCEAEKNGVLSWTSGECNYVIKSLKIDLTSPMVGDTCHIVTTLNEEIQWNKYTISSSNETIATVNNNGMIFTKGEGYVDITVTDVSNGFSVILTLNVVINEIPGSVNLLYAMQSTLQVHDTTSISWNINSVIPWDTYSVTTDESVVKYLGNGMIVATGLGESTITITDMENQITKSIIVKVLNIFTIDIIISQLPNSENPYSILIEYSTISDNCNTHIFGSKLSNDTIYIGVSSTLMSCDPMEYTTETFTKEINGLSPGTYLITDGYITKAFTIEAIDDPIFALYLTKNTINEGVSVFLTWDVLSLIPWDVYTVTSSDESVAKYQGNGIIKGVGNGNTTINITNSATGVSRSIPIWVQGTFNTSISVTEISSNDDLYNVLIQFTGIFDCCNTQMMGCRVSNDSIYIGFASTLMLCTIPDTCVKTFTDTLKGLAAGTYIIMNNIYIKSVTIGKPTPDIISIKIINSGSAIEVTFYEHVELYNGIENDFIIMGTETLKSGTQYQVSKVMAKDGDPKTLVLIMETAVPETGIISVQFKNGEEFNAATGLNDASQSIVKAYPVPVKTVVTIEAEDIKQVEVLSLEGKSIKTESASGNKTNISFEDIKSGMYIVKITTATKTESILIEKK